MRRLLSVIFHGLRYRNTPIRFRADINGMEIELRLKGFCNEQLVVNGKNKGITTWVELEPFENNED